MLNLLLSLGAALLVGSPFALMWGWWAGILPGLAAGIGVYILLSRRIAAQLQAIRTRAEVELKEGRWERAVKVMESGYPLQRRQFLIKAQIDAQIGAIYYMSRKYKEAEPYLENAMRTDPMARGMLAAGRFRRHKLDEAVDIIEETLKFSGKNPLLWALYAYMLDKAGKKDEAIKVLNRAVDKVPDNEPLQQNLMALKNGQKFKTKPFGDGWYIYGFDLPSKQSRVQGFRPKAGRVPKKMR